MAPPPVVAPPRPGPSAPAPETDPHTGPCRGGTPRDRLRHAIGHAAHLLPAQGPITVFIHHNTLHAFEDLPFEQAVERAGELFGCQPYLSEQRYRDALVRGRIRFPELLAVLEADLGDRAAERVAPGTTRLDLRLAALQHPLASGSTEELKWFLVETDALRRVCPAASAAARGRLLSETRRWVMRDVRSRNGANPAWLRDLLGRFGAAEIESWTEARWEAFTLETLWGVCRDGAAAVPDAAPPPAPPVRHRDLLLRAAHVDTDQWVNDALVRFSAAYLDQGVSHWPLPDRDLGYFPAFCSLYRRGGGPPDRWLRGLAAEADRLAGAGADPLASAHESLEALGVPEAEWDAYLSATLLALRGWGGMIHEVEARGDRVARPVRADSLVGFLAVRLLLERLALAHAAAEHLGHRGPLAGLRDALRARVAPPAPRSVEQRVVPVFQLAQVLGWSPAELARLGPDGWGRLVGEVEGFGAVPRRRVFHRAYEARFRTQALDALALHARRRPPAPRFQVVACLDEREESFRRHLEEVAPDCETFGAAGFFAVAMYYKGAADAHFVPLCPIVLTPKHWVEERADAHLAGAHERLRWAHRALGAAAHAAHVGTRTPVVGAVLAATLGVLASVPLVGRVLFPRLTARVRHRLGRAVQVAPRTRLELERVPECAPGDRGPGLGFTLDEMAAAAERLLRDTGLTRTFGRLVFVIGHGSGSLNNPHKSAYDCGACGGSPGAPNGRAAARVLNDPRVRARLAAMGIAVPEATRFVGGFHNTCDDSVALFDEDQVPESHRAEVRAVKEEFARACERNAHERCRRFMSAPLTQSAADAKRHVEGRSEDLAQTRPELGHATNAICHVGRRERTRGLYLDRRAFLTAYDPTQDDGDGTVLARTMAAVFPVCGGINLEYFFSHVDSPGYGCGTKLPHNITSLLGVMDGAASDLRTGLPWQMTEIHEPVRLMIVCETTPAVMQRVLDGNPLGKKLTENGWVQLAVQSPDTNDVLLYDRGAFRPYHPQADVLPAAKSSADWYRGWRDHLEFAEIG
ncbi:DUF2309 domain-containing protein [Gemmata sp.]|uniref:DUF2309 domain-containing protein n=1 Tax=Gemmata sp. TaxID=1914242 RepID=UPI003F6F08AB